VKPASVMRSIDSYVGFQQITRSSVTISAGGFARLCQEIALEEADSARAAAPGGLLGSPVHKRGRHISAPAPVPVSTKRDSRLENREDVDLCGSCVLPDRDQVVVANSVLIRDIQHHLRLRKARISYCLPQPVSAASRASCACALAGERRTPPG
jgi:hypothetical protein